MRRGRLRLGGPRSSRGPLPRSVSSSLCHDDGRALYFRCAARRRGRRGFLPCLRLSRAELTDVIHKLSRLGIDVGRWTNISRRSMNTLTKTELANPLVLDLLADVRRHYHIGPVDSRRER